MEQGYTRRLLLCLLLACFLPVMPVCGQTRQAAPPPPAANRTSARPHQSKANELKDTLLRFTGKVPDVYLQKKPLMRNKHGWPCEFERFSINTALFRLVNDHRAPWLDAFFIVLLYLGSGYMMVPVTILTGFLYRQRLWVLLVAIAIESLLVTVMKQGFIQPRPGGILHNVFVVEELSWRSFPSGDTAMAFTIAWALKSGLRRPARAVFIVYAVAIAYERMYLGAHFPLDVLAGAAVGILSVMLAERLLKRKRGEKPVKEDPQEPEAEEAAVCK